MKATTLPKISEAEFTRQVIELAKYRGWKCAHFRPAVNRRGKWATPVQGDGAGFPDLILARRGRVLAVELKVGRNVPTPEQMAWLNAFTEAGVSAWVWHPSDWKWIEAELAGADGPKESRPRTGSRE
jgi:hypothetical protein